MPHDQEYQNGDVHGDDAIETDSPGIGRREQSHKDAAQAEQDCRGEDETCALQIVATLRREGRHGKGTGDLPTRSGFWQNASEGFLTDVSKACGKKVGAD